MVKDVTISARISEELSEQLTSLAQALGRNRSWVIEEALRGYIASEQQFLTAVEEGLRDLEAGGTWLGVNGHGVLIAVTNRHKVDVPAQPRSRI